MRTRILILLIGLAGCGAPASQTSTTASTTPNVRLADAAFASGNPTIALQALDNLLASDPNNTDALLRHARADAMLGNKSSAESFYRRALAANPSLTEARIGLGKILLATNAAEAETQFAAVVRADSRNVSALNNLGVARDLQGKHPEAQEAYHKALELQPSLASARQNLGLSLAVSGNPEEGVKMLGSAAQNGGADRKARDNFAVALAMTGRTQEAGKVLQEEMSSDDASKVIASLRALRGSPPSPTPSE